MSETKSHNVMEICEQLREVRRSIYDLRLGQRTFEIDTLVAVALSECDKLRAALMRGVHAAALHPPQHGNQNDPRP